MPHPIIQAEVDEFRKFAQINDFYQRGFPMEKMEAFLSAALQRAIEKAGKVDENTSDGHHTFKELYEFRLIYNANLFNEWAKQGLYNVHKSTRHFEGDECFGGGWFIVVAQLPDGQISNHYEMKDWDLFQCRDFETALLKWDGHTPQDVATRLRSLALSKLDTIINFKE